MRQQNTHASDDSLAIKPLHENDPNILILVSCVKTPGPPWILPFPFSGNRAHLSISGQDDQRCFVIVVISALEEEIRDLKRGMSIKRVSSYHCCRFYEGKYANKDIVLVLTGQGGEHAKQVTQLVLATYPVRVLISTGFCGSLNSKTEVGDIVVYSRLSFDDGASEGLPAGELIADPKLVEAASRISGEKLCQTITGRGLTVARVCAKPEEKRRLGKEFAADVVDMESHSIGQVTLERKLPFIAVRAVFDNVRDDLSILDDMTSGDKIVPRRVLFQLASHPSKAINLIQLVNNSRKARRSLAIFLAELIENI
jgi:adenosylhomocysteine nucleosidase